VSAAATAARASPQSASGRREGDHSGVQRDNFTRSGYAPAASPLESSYLNTSGVTGTTQHDAAAVQRNWERGMSGPDGTAPTHQSDAAFSGIPQPDVDLTGMTEEQRELLEYLQARVESFERERVDFLQRLDEMAGSSGERHTLKWEVRKKDEQMMDLQKALSDAHVFLYEERAQVLKLTAENDRLKSTSHNVLNHDMMPVCDSSIMLTSHALLLSACCTPLQSRSWRIVSGWSICWL